MNQFTKLAPNVWGMKTDTEYQYGDTATVATKRGKEIEVQVFNLVKTDANGAYYYSTIRTDGMNNQAFAQKRADRRAEWAEKAEAKSNAYYDKSNAHRDFLSLGEPIKVGHHSERRHRRIIDQAHNNMGKSIEMSRKAEEHERKAEYWENRAKKIDLSMPDCLGYFEAKLEEARANHQQLKDHPELREHSYSLTYANKHVKELSKKVDLAKKLWGQPV